jgi:mutator protein MutT
MANSELYDKTFRVPSDVLKHIQSVLVSNPTGDGVKRAKNILRSGVITYQGMKRLKNFFDYFNPNTDDKAQYELAGGDLMKGFVESKLKSERDGVRRGDEIKSTYKIDPNLGTKTQQTPKLNEEEDKELKKNAVAIIVNNDNKILLLKRSEFIDQWMPNKWSLVGGAVDKGETSEKACKREVEEETGLEINDFINSFTIKRHKDSIESIFVTKYDGEPTDINLNDENVSYGWYSVPEMKFLDTVPHLIEYVTLAFKKYD